MKWLALRLLRPYVAVAAALTVASTALIIYGAYTVQQQLNERGLPHCVNPDLCYPDGSAMTAVLLMELIAAFVPSLIGLILGVPLFTREREDDSITFGLTQSVSRQRWVLTKLLCAMATGAICAAVVATTYRLVATRYTVLANDTYEGIDWLHFNNIGLMVMQAVFLTAVAGVIGLATGRTLRTLVLSLICWPLGIVAVCLGFILISYVFSWLPIHVDTASGPKFSENDDRYWTADITYLEYFGYWPMAILVVYVPAVVLIARRIARRVPR